MVFSNYKIGYVYRVQRKNKKVVGYTTTCSGFTNNINTCENPTCIGMTVFEEENGFNTSECGHSHNRNLYAFVGNSIGTSNMRW